MTKEELEIENKKLAVQLHRYKLKVHRFKVLLRKLQRERSCKT